MKKTLFLFLAMASMAGAQDFSGMGFVFGPAPVMPARNILHPRDPLRQFGDKLYTVTGVGDGWVEFEGKVLEVQPGGVRIQGSYTGYGFDGGDYTKEFFVTNFPYQVAEDEFVGNSDSEKLFYCARVAGTYTYATAIGGSRTIRMIDYGTIYTPPPPPPPTPEQIAAAKEKAIAAKQLAQKKSAEAAERALKLNQEAADKNDPLGLWRMGERYRDGDGVARDLPKAREYLTKAVAAGAPAQAELAALPAQ